MKSKLLRVVLLMVMLGGVTVAIVYRDRIDIQALEQWIRGTGAAGPILFMFSYIVATIFFLPGSIITMAGGVLFGPVLGTFYNLTGATLGAVVAFLISRYLAADWVEKKVAGRIKQLKEGVEAEGWRFVAFVRLVPIFPFFILNYALGLTRIRLWDYTIATYIFMLPGAIAFTYLGYAGKEAIAGGEGMIQKIMLALGLLAVVGFLPSLVARLRRGPMMDVRTLQEKMQQHSELLVLDVRGSDEFAGEQGHIASAMNIPVQELTTRLEEIVDYEEKTIAIVCRTDKRSARAAQILGRKGFADVHVVRGGMTAWNEAGLPLA